MKNVFSAAPYTIISSFGFHSLFCTVCVRGIFGFLASFGSRAASIMFLVLRGRCWGRRMGTTRECGGDDEFALRCLRFGTVRFILYWLWTTRRTTSRLLESTLPSCDLRLRLLHHLMVFGHVDKLLTARLYFKPSHIYTLVFKFRRYAQVPGTIAQ